MKFIYNLEKDNKNEAYLQSNVFKQMIEYLKTDITNWALYLPEMESLFKENNISDSVKDMLYGFFLSFRLSVLILCFDTQENNSFDIKNLGHKGLLVSLWGIQITDNHFGTIQSMQSSIQIHNNRTYSIDP